MQQTREKIDLLQQISDNSKNMLAMIGAVAPSVAPSWQMVIDHFEEYRRRTKTGEPVAWLNFGIPSELFFAMDIEPMCSDFLSWLAASAGHNLEYIDMAEEQVADHVCSDFKIHFGLMMSGDVPHPDIMVTSASPCDSVRTTYSALAANFDIPTFVVDEPYFRSERGYQYIAGQLKELVLLLEELTGRELDLDKLKQVMEYSNEAHYWFNKLNEFRPLIPNPFPSFELFMDAVPLTLFTGTPELAEYYKKRYHEVNERVETGVGYPQVEEKIRVVWPYGMYTDLGVLSWLEQKYGAVSVNYMKLDCAVQPVEDISTYDSIMRGLAEKTVLLPMNREIHGPIDNFIDATLNLCRNNKADCVIVMGHVGCKSNWAGMKLYKDVVEEKLGIPVSVFELDLFDVRIMSVDAARAKFEEFFETRVIPNMEKKKG